MKTNKLTFAQKAQRIQSKYPRAAFDPHEKAELEREMDALIQEQEAFKQAMGIDAMPEQQMKLDANQAMMEGQMEEPQMFAGGSTGNDFDLLLKNKLFPTSIQGNEIPFAPPPSSPVVKVGSGITPKPVVAPSIYNLTPEEQLSAIREKSANTGINTPMEPIKAAALPSNLNIPKTLDVGQIQAGMRKPVKGVKDGSNQFLPSYIAAGTSALGNIAQMFLDKKPKDVNFARYAPEEIDLTEQRLAAERAADLSRSVGRTTARNLGMNAGSTMANMMSTESDVSRNLSNALLQSKLQEQTTNVGERNKAGQMNTEMGMREAMINRGMQDDWKNRQREYLAGAVQTVPDAMKDINQIKYQYEMLKQMGTSEENALKWLNQKYPNYKADIEKMITKLKKD